MNHIRTLQPSKKRILVQDHGGYKFQTTGILKYVEELEL